MNSNNNEISSLLTEEPLNKIHPKSNKSSTLRYVTFNINGANTLFNYHPWNKFNQDYNALFQSLQADIITLQELKLSNQTLPTIKDIGHLRNYKSFISLPISKKGYSGVGLFVRIPDSSESKNVKRNLTVIRAEEGITGWLSSKLTNGDTIPSRPSPYRDQTDNNIGGYPDIDELEGLAIDSEGRCVCIELANSLVVFALYCPANSQGTEEGEKFRLKFLQILFERAYELKFKLGKEVIIMGDINVSPDLIDNAEGMKDRINENLIRPSLTSDGYNFEIINYEECWKFKSSTKARELLNKYTIPGLWHDLILDTNTQKAVDTQFLYDSTRFIQGRKMNIYTVWNTLTGARQINHGSRIDLILCSCYNMVKRISKADIWPFILGSDHCPVFTDFDVELDEDQDIDEEHQEHAEVVPTKLNFEAKYHYKLSKSRDISTLFGSKKTPSESTSRESTPNSASSSQRSIESSQPPAKKPKLQYTSRKTQQKQTNQKPISGFFK
ncbi:APN2 [[Candida] subhashii]|uniref:APN2 n=1 Tax=[Candida] subhashii TaxID=561895 RepID=A0A8J5R4K3_9ASCO|nr:APN2 [[Candida] subhashii]KAG7665305.1 APN2 [[Candida] subhashii]